MFQKFYRLTDWRCCVQISWNVTEGKSAKSCVGPYLQDKKQQQNFACLTNSRYCADRAQNLPGQPQQCTHDCSRFHPNRFAFGGVIAERANTAKLPRRVNPIGGVENAGVENAGVETTGEDSRGGNCRSGRSRSRSHGWNMQEWKIQELKHMKSRPYRNLWRSKL